MVHGRRGRRRSGQHRTAGLSRFRGRGVGSGAPSTHQNHRLIARNTTELARLKREKGARKGPYTGEPGRLKKKFDRELADLHAGRLPGEVQPQPQVAPAARIASAASPAGAAHHAQPASQRGRGQGRGGRGASAHAGAAARAPAARAPAAAAAGDDDDDEDPELAKLNYYKCGAAQATFNKRKTREYITGGTASAMASFTYTPPDPLKTGCARSDIGLGKLHVYAPQKHLPLPPPPCPYGHGWRAVDGNQITTHGACAARRCSGEDVDEWVSGMRMVCKLCEAERKTLEEELKELNEEAESGGIDEEDGSIRVRTPLAFRRPPLTFIASLRLLFFSPPFFYY